MPEKLLDPFRITNGRKFRLADVRPNDTCGLKSKEDARKGLEKGIEHLADLQEKLYAQDQWGVLLIFQAMDAAGKDGAIAHVMSGVNPQGCQVFSFKAPSAEETRPRLPLADDALPPGARPDRHLQPVLLRGDARRPGPPRDPGEAAPAEARGDEADLEGAVRGRRRVRAATSRATATRS